MEPQPKHGAEAIRCFVAFPHGKLQLRWAKGTFLWAYRY